MLDLPTNRGSATVPRRLDQVKAIVKSCQVLIIYFYHDPGLKIILPILFSMQSRTVVDLDTRMEGKTALAIVSECFSLRENRMRLL